MNYFDLSIVLQDEIQRIFTGIRNIVSKNSDLIHITHDEDLRIVVEHLNPKSGYCFTIDNPKKDAHNRITFVIEKKPKNLYESIEHRYSILSNTKNPIQAAFSDWIDIIKRADKFNPHPKDKILEDYEERFYNSIQFLDDKDDNKALSFKNKNALNKSLNNIIEYVSNDKTLNEDEDSKEEIIQELKELNALIPQLTQGQIKKRLASVSAKMYYKGIDIINWIATQGSSFGFGYLMSEVIKKLG